MQYHHRGYLTGDPRIESASTLGLGRPDDLPEKVDVIIVGAGPTGHIAAAQLAQFPGVSTRLIDRAAERLDVGRADGVQARSVETFQAFGFANRIVEEAYRITAMAFWGPDPGDPSQIVRTGLPADDGEGISEFPHLVVNQARVQDYFAEVMINSPARMRPDYGIEFLDLVISESGGTHPVSVRVRYLAGSRAGQTRTITSKYVIGADGARSKVRRCIGAEFSGQQAQRAWGVVDVLAVTDFPDIRRKCAIQSRDGGTLLLIPREGGYLSRLYVDLGETAEDDGGAVGRTPVEEIVERANYILRPYTLDVRCVVWQSVYEVGQRLADRFDDVEGGARGTRMPRVFIAGDACHTHSAKAGLGMNVSMQDGFNLAWKLGHVLVGLAPEALLSTYSLERRPVAQALIDFDKHWSSLMAATPDELASPSAVRAFHAKASEFTAGFMTEYAPSILTAERADHNLAVGFPVGKRFKSAEVIRVCDANPVHLGHQARADGRWRIYAFADAALAGEQSALSEFAEWIVSSPDAPLAACSLQDADLDACFDVKVVYQQRFDAVELSRVPSVFLPVRRPFGLTDYEKVYAIGPGPDGSVGDIFEMRRIDRDGVLVVVRPDQYVATVLPLSSTDALRAFFKPLLLHPRRSARRSSPVG